MMGDTGPCGPCSEVHIDLTPDGDTRGALVNKNDPRCIEIWNLVFIQFNANPDGTFTPLPQRHVDTGMGFERAVAIIQGTRNLTDFSGTISNYETDVFRPIFDELEKLSGKEIREHAADCRERLAVPGAGGSQPERPPYNGSQNRKKSTSLSASSPITFARFRSQSLTESFLQTKAAVTFCVAFLRRAVRYGRTLGFHEPFFFKLVDVVAKTMGDVFPEVRTQQSKIKETIRREEEAFNKTLDKGIEVFEALRIVRCGMTDDGAKRYVEVRPAASNKNRRLGRISRLCI